VWATNAPETNSATALTSRSAEARGDFDFMKLSGQCEPWPIVHHTLP
jgi:hypothetical protein